MPQPTNPEPQPQPNEKLIKIFDTEQENEAIVVQGLLESAGIQSDLKSLDAVQDAFPGVGGSVLLVREQDAPEATKDYRSLSQPAAPGRRNRRHHRMNECTGLPCAPEPALSEVEGCPLWLRISRQWTQRRTVGKYQCSSVTSEVTDSPSK